VINGFDKGSCCQVWMIAEQGGIEVLVEALKESDNVLLDMALRAVSQVLLCGTDTKKEENVLANKFEDVGGVKVLEELQKHENERIHELSVSILCKYYNVEEIMID